jgi:Uma2 family endonuclease
VVCGESEFEDKNLDTLVNPTLIIEVLSESTESYDRGQKFAHCRNIPSLREYVLVSQWEYRIEDISRTDEGNWTFTECADPAGSIRLTSVDGNLTLSSVYDRVDLERVRSRRNRQNMS